MKIEKRCKMLNNSDQVNNGGKTFRSDELLSFLHGHFMPFVPIWFRTFKTKLCLTITNDIMSNFLDNLRRNIDPVSADFLRSIKN